MSDNSTSPVPNEATDSHTNLERLQLVYQSFRDVVKSLRSYFTLIERVEQGQLPFQDAVKSLQHFSALEQLSSIEAQLGGLAKATEEQPELSQVKILLDGLATLHASLDREAILTQTLEVAFRLTNAHYGFLLEGRTGQGNEADLQVIRSVGNPPDDPELRFHWPIVEEVLNTGEGIVETNLFKNPLFAFGHSFPIPFYSILCAPLRWKPDDIGIIYLAQNYRWEFLPRDLYLVTVLSEQAGIALNNALLFEQARKG